jgi:hypothetical protein
MVALTAAAVACGTAGLALTIRASRRGWAVAPAAVLVAGLAAAVLLALVPPFGSADHLSYAAYGRMVTTGHNPYTTTPAALARLGDPVARAVRTGGSSPVYGLAGHRPPGAGLGIGGPHPADHLVLSGSTWPRSAAPRCCCTRGGGPPAGPARAAGQPAAAQVLISQRPRRQPGDRSSSPPPSACMILRASGGG